MKTSEASKFFDESIKPEIERFVDNSLGFAFAVNKVLEDKGITQYELAYMMGVDPEVIYGQLSGLHNLTLKEISNIEVALGVEIINYDI